MTYVIGTACVDVMDKSCVQECPVGCIYEGARVLYIHPEECVDCGACKLICKVEAIYYDDDLPEDQQRHLADNAAFFIHRSITGSGRPSRFAGRRCQTGRAGRGHAVGRRPAATGLMIAASRRNGVQSVPRTVAGPRGGHRKE
jgi:NAD-dependent dihydropyrimidine dehydrogenase PreA subunit